MHTGDPYGGGSAGAASSLYPAEYESEDDYLRALWSGSFSVDDTQCVSSNTCCCATGMCMYACVNACMYVCLHTLDQVWTQPYIYLYTYNHAYRQREHVDFNKPRSEDPG